jgi:hypothetical protein
MPTGTFEYRSDAERLAIEAAIAFVADLHRLALTAPDGQVLDRCEQQALAQGRDLLRSALQRAVQTRIDQAEPKGGPHAAVRAPARSASSDAASGRR